MSKNAQVRNSVALQAEIRGPLIPMRPSRVTYFFYMKRDSRDLLTRPCLPPFIKPDDIKVLKLYVQG